MTVTLWLRTIIILAGMIIAGYLIYVGKVTRDWTYSAIFLSWVCLVVSYFSLRWVAMAINPVTLNSISQGLYISGMLVIGIGAYYELRRKRL